MTTSTLRERLREQIDILPGDVVQQIADFTFFIMNRKTIGNQVYGWSDDNWRAFALEQFFRDEDEVSYTLKDAEEIYHP